MYTQMFQISLARGGRAKWAIGRLLALVMLAGIGLALSACSNLPAKMAPLQVMTPGEGYVLEPGNRVRIGVFNENNLSGDFTIDPAGNIFLPLIGNIPASGVTAKVLAGRVEDTLTKNNYMRNPKVSVEVQTFRPFYVLGEVRQPGEFPYTTGITVLTAIARAGGYDYRAREGEVMLIRTIDGEQQEFRATERTLLQPGDVVKVVQRYF
jgi:polysaccharide export outer membrane protein